MSITPQGGPRVIKSESKPRIISGDTEGQSSTYIRSIKVRSVFDRSYSHFLALKIIGHL